MTTPAGGLEPDMQERIWTCKIGAKCGELPNAADWPMRRAVENAFKALTGVDAEYAFTGWGGGLDEVERAVVEDREPDWGRASTATASPLEPFDHAHPDSWKYEAQGHPTERSALQPEAPCDDLKDKFHSALGRYWDCAYAEGKEGRECDDFEGRAQQTLGELLDIFDTLFAETQRSPQPSRPNEKENPGVGVRVGATPEPLTDDDRLLKFLCDLHEHLPDEQRPMSWSDFSDGQIARARKAWAALRAPEPLTAEMLADAFMSGAAWREQVEESEAATEKTAKSYARAALEGGVSPQPSRTATTAKRSPLQKRSGATSN